jgi:HD-like signal output (HDOD) protein
MNQLADKVADAINRAIEADKLVLPTMPETALRVREVADDPDASLKDMAAVIGNDAALTVRIIKVANSPLYRASSQIEDLNMALMRLGITLTSSLATGLAMEQMFQATSDIVDRRLREVWKRSTEVAGICAVLCKHCTKLRTDQATLAGLVHQIGVLPILSYAEEHPVLLKDGISLDSVIEQIHPKLGTKILSSWDFPLEIRNVPSEHLNFSRKADKADYADLVTVAMLQSHLSSGEQFADVDFTTVTAFSRLGLDPEVQVTEAEDLSEEMEAAIAALQ